MLQASKHSLATTTTTTTPPPPVSPESPAHVAVFTVTKKEITPCDWTVGQALTALCQRLPSSPVIWCIWPARGGVTPGRRNTLQPSPGEDVGLTVSRPTRETAVLLH